MPIATIQIVAGRDARKKHKLMTAVSQAIAASLEAPMETVRVIVQEVPADLWSVGGQTIAEQQAARAAVERV